MYKINAKFLSVNRGMRIVLFALFVIVNSSCAQKQDNYSSFGLTAHNAAITDLNGKWRIDKLITDEAATEYTLYPQDPNQGSSYGNNISLNGDQTFISSYSADCGNDCFTTTLGKFKVIDRNYICFYLEKISRSGECSGDSQPNNDLGLYYYYKDRNVIRLVKSAGNIEDDKRKEYYRTLLAAKQEEINMFDENSIIHWLNSWKHTNLTNEDDIIRFCMAENNIKGYEVLHRLKSDPYRATIIFLVEINKELRYVIYEPNYRRVSLYEDTEINRIDKIVSEIDSQKALSRRSFKEPFSPLTSSSDQNTITLYSNGQDVRKAVYLKIFANGGQRLTTTMYIRNSTPIYVNYDRLNYNENDKLTSRTGMYILDWKNNKAAIKTIEKGAGALHPHDLGQNISIILEEIKKRQ
ncbi:MAG TPA: hypothetical protein VGB43_04250 [Flavobacterium sp.]